MALFAFFPVSDFPDTRSWNMEADRADFAQLIFQSLNETGAADALTLHYDSSTVTFSGAGLSYARDATGDISDIPTGRITGMRVQLNDGRTVLDVTGLDIDAPAFATLLAREDSVSLYNLLLAGSDRVTGGRNADVLVSHAGDDTLVGGRGDDRLSGEAGRDSLMGGTGRDTLDGGGEGDRLDGGGGNDVLNGGAGWDTLIGGTGRDVLAGGGGADRFVFRSTAESAVAVEAADVIADFRRGLDRIDLRQIDAFAPTGGDDAFVWIGTGAFAAAGAGEIRLELRDVAGTASDLTVVQIDTDGDAAAEMTIVLNGLHALTASDFLL